MLSLTANLLRSRLGITCAVLLLVLAIVFAFQPLIGTLGYESALGITLPACLVGAALGLRAGALRLSTPAAAPLMLSTPLHHWWGATLAALGCLAPAFSLLCISAAWRAQCDFGGALAWWGLLPVMSMVFCAAIGLALRRVLPRHERTASVVFVGFIVFAIMRALWRGLDTPIVIAHSHFFGYVGGPIYDEVLHIPDSLLYLRVYTAGLTALILFGLWALDSRRRSIGIAAGLLAIGCAFMSANRVSVGIDLGREEIQEALGGRVETDHFVIHWDQFGGVPEDRLQEIVDDHEYRYQQLHRFFDLTSEEKITSYVFANNDRKAELMGARDSQIANPYRREIYIGYRAPPHPVLKHELVHAASEEFGGPFGASIKLGLVEGVAEAGDWTSSGDRDPHRETAAMLAQDELLPAASLVGWTFYFQRQAKAYTAAGSFSRYLIDTYGVDKFRQVYGWGKFEKVYGKDIDALDAEWRQFLAAIALDEGEMLRAERRFAAPSIFEVPCARVAAELEERAWDAYGARRYGQAELLFTELANINEGPKPWRGLMFTYMAADRVEEARDALEGWQTRENEGSAGWIESQAFRGELEWQAGNLEEAAKLFQEVYDVHLSPYWDRRLSLTLQALADEELRDDMRVLWSGGRHGEPARLRLARADRSGVGGPAANYMLGRNLLYLREPEQALQYLWAADDPGLTDPSTVAELYLMTGRALYELERYDEAGEVFSRVQQLTGLRGEQVGWATDWVERSAWKDAQP